MTAKLKYISYIVIALAALTIFIIAPSRCRRDVVEVRHDTIVVIDTVVKPVTCIVTKEIVDTMFVSDLDTLTVHDTVFVVIPIEQKHYHFDDTADIYISGYNARIDSAFFHYKTLMTVEAAPMETRPLVFGLETGFDAVFSESKIIPGVYIDAGLTIKRKVAVKFGIGANYDNGVKAFMHGGVAYIIR